MMPMNGHFSGFHMKQTQVTTRKQKAPHSQQERNECGTDYRAFGTHRNNLIGTSIREQLEAKMKTSTRDHHPQLKNTNNLLRLLAPIYHLLVLYSSALILNHHYIVRSRKPTFWYIFLGLHH